MVLLFCNTKANSGYSKNDFDKLTIVETHEAQLVDERVNQSLRRSSLSR